MLNARQSVEWRTVVVKSRLPTTSSAVRARRRAGAERQRFAVRVCAAVPSPSTAGHEAKVDSATDSSTNATPDTAPSAPAQRTSSSKKKEKGIHFRELRDEQGEV